ncbi:MAG: putative DNA-binding protein [Phascolarctobacterium sp.]|nr:putative DNA-binding protein [Phascolarctobacterium sp.]
MSAEEIFEQRMRLSRLFSLYGGLLTEKQQQCLSFYFDDDLSLSEIADELGVSRQAVYDLLKRVEQTLEKYESRLGLLAKKEEQEAKLQQVMEMLSNSRMTNKKLVLGLLEDIVNNN